MSIEKDWNRVEEDLKAIGKDLKETKFDSDKYLRFGKHLGKTLVKTIEYGAASISKWANTEDPADNCDTSCGSDSEKD